jgi:hypothetical protein
MQGSLAKAVFLTIDSASKSGVALSEPEIDDRGVVRGYSSPSYAEVSSQKERHQWVRDAVRAAIECKLPLVIVGEQWTAGMSYSSYVTLVESWGMWRAAIEYEGAHRTAHIVRVHHQTWRAAVFGKRRPKDRASLKKFAIEYIHQKLGEPRCLSDNIAEALCLRVWAARADEVHELLAPKKRRKAA